MLLLPDRCALIGMVHLQPLPGSPGWAGDLEAVRDAALADARALAAGGVDAMIVENMGDAPYLKGAVAPETTAAAAVLCAAVVQAVDCPVGVQILAGAARESLGVALAAGARFLRVEGFAYAHVADEGSIDACAGPLLRTRAALGASVQLWADVRKKHSAHAVTADLSLEELARGTAFCGADALVITGPRTGARTNPTDVRVARAAGLPVVVGSGVDERDVARLAPLADALIVGSSLKRGGSWRAPVDQERVRRLADALRTAAAARP